MAVRVRVGVESDKGSVETSALVNSGFESETPLILLPLKLAERLGFSIAGLAEESYIGAGGTAVIVYPLPEKLRISVITDDREVGPVETDASVSMGEREVILGDAVSSELKISINDLKKGIWRFSDEDRSRESVGKEEWI